MTFSLVPTITSRRRHISPTTSKRRMSLDYITVRAVSNTGCETWRTFLQLAQLYLNPSRKPDRPEPRPPRRAIHHDLVLECRDTWHLIPLDRLSQKKPDAFRKKKKRNGDTWSRRKVFITFIYNLNYLFIRDAAVEDAAAVGDDTPRRLIMPGPGMWCLFFFRRPFLKTISGRLSQRAVRCYSGY